MWKRLFLWGTVLTIAVVLVGLSFMEHPEQVPAALNNIAAGQREMRKMYGSQEAIDTVRHADRVLLYNIHYPAPYHDFSKATLGQPVALLPDEARLLAQEISNPLLYAPDLGALTSCEPIWGVKAVFVKGDRKVGLLYCQWCKHIAIDPIGQEGLTAYQKADAPNASNLPWLQAVSPALEAAIAKHLPHNDEAKLVKSMSK